tara:strand:- start:290 stop:601 length:312 start_codon:yes stop_codon:yes gene_type:complete
MKRTCQECGVSYVAKKSSSKFCSTSCRKTFNNRRAQRGALMYDAFMGLRYDRAAAKAAGIDYTFICRIGEMFNDEDAGKRTYRPAADVVKDKGVLVNGRRSRI